MCGICGIVSLNGGPPPEVDLLTRMMGRLRHRGPDSSGYYRDKQASLGHTRLAIIDLEQAPSPYPMRMKQFGSHSTVKYSIMLNSLPNYRIEDMYFGQKAIQRSLYMLTRNGVHHVLNALMVNGHWHCGIRGKARLFFPVTVSV